MAACWLTLAEIELLHDFPHVTHAHMNTHLMLAAQQEYLAVKEETLHTAECYGSLKFSTCVHFAPKRGAIRTDATYISQSQFLTYVLSSNAGTIMMDYKINILSPE
ncbi:hypothetical protein EDD11_001856 [Mortierella claussenii]|nr:hypothetical protein EDD11_001856 [Mortierella claussenii]